MPWFVIHLTISTSIVKRFGAKDAAPAKIGKTGAYARAAAGFMGKEWDGGDIAFGSELWREVYRVSKTRRTFARVRRYADLSPDGLRYRKCRF